MSREPDPHRRAGGPARERSASPPTGGLCPACRNVRVVRSAGGATFLLCLLSKEDAALPKYPPQPVVSCPGFAR